MEMPVDQAVARLGAQLAIDRQGAIGEIYAALGSTVLRYLQRLVGHDDAEDVLQRVFYEVWRHNGRYDPSRSLAAWVLGIARNRAIDHLRRQRSTAVALENLGDIPGEDGRELAERSARSREVRDALNRLPDEQREVLVLAYFGGYTRSEIATRLELPLGTVKARAFRGLRRLADLLAPYQSGTAGVAAAALLVGGAHPASRDSRSGEQAGQQHQVEDDQHRDRGRGQPAQRRAVGEGTHDVLAAGQRDQGDGHGR
jgi:RNA polymerase sigma factor (sigma-70 family)